MQRHVGANLVLAQPGVDNSMLAHLVKEPAKRQGVKISPMSPAAVGRRVGGLLELDQDVVPVVPLVLGDPKHLHVRPQVISRPQGRSVTGRAGNHDRPPRVGTGLVVAFDLGLVIGGDEVVDLQKVDAPLAVQFHQRVQVGLRPRMAHLQPIRQVRPSADARGVGDLPARNLVPFTGRLAS